MKISNQYSANLGVQVEKSNLNFKSRRLKIDDSFKKIPEHYIEAIKNSEEIRKAQKFYHFVISPNKQDMQKICDEISLSIVRRPILSKIKKLMYKLSGNTFVSEPVTYKIILNNINDIKSLTKSDIDSFVRN